MRLTLSFDNGPFPDVTPGVLDALASHGAPATFFVVGEHARGAPERALLRRVQEAGHRIGNHTLTHRVELGTTDDAEVARREIEDAQRLLADFAEPERLFRPYGGGGVLGPTLLGPPAVEVLRAGGYTCVLWSSVPRDWERVDDWPEVALSDMQSRDWTLLVLHDVPTGAMKQLPRFLERVRVDGVEIVADYPPECVPIVGGEPRPGLEAYVGPRSEPAGA